MAWLIDYPREKVPWFPIIDSAKCVKCGMCMNCGREVYEWTASGPIVLKPNECVVGCTTCSNLCLGEAISHPPVSELRELYKNEHIWSKVKSDLLKHGIIK